MPEHAMNERDIFLVAVDQPDHASRERYLDEVCAGNPSLRDKVLQLLAASDRAGEFLEQPPSCLALTVQTDDPGAGRESLRDLSLDFLTPSEKSGCWGTLGQYEVVGLVGRGGFGLVLRAYDTKLNRIVAIKVMAPELASNPMAVTRFLREARAAAAVRHDHVVTIHAIEEASSPPFLVMEYVEGVSLKEKVDTDGALETLEILRIGMQMASGLAAAYQQGLVHRDIKPANILLENGIKRVKITDFGLARAVDDVGVTQTGMIAGTPQYMSPEQGLGKPIDARSDLFSLGSVLYTLCTGRPAFRADSAVATLRRVCDDDPRPIRQINPQIPEWLDRIIMRLLEKNADKRFQSAVEVVELLSACLAHAQSAGNASSLPNTLFAPAPARKGSKLAASAFVALVGIQLCAILGSFVAAIIEIESIVFTGPVFGVAVGSAIALAAWKAKLGWRSIGFGLSSVLLSFSVVFVIVAANLGTNQPAPILAMLIVYVLVALPWGGYVLRQALTAAPGVTFRQAVFQSRGVYIGVYLVQLIGIAAAAANAAIEIESIVGTGILFGLVVGLALSVLSLTAGRERSSVVFAFSAPIFSLLLLFLVLILDWSTTSTGGRAELIIARMILFYATLIVPLGTWALARELELFATTDPMRPQFNLKTGLAATAMFAFAFTGARPCYAFGMEAFLAGGLFTMTLVSTAALLGYAFYKREGRYTPLRWLGIGVATLVLLTTFMGLVVWYDTETAYGSIVVRSPERVTLAVKHLSSGTTHLYEIDDNGGLIHMGVPSGPIHVSVLERDDLRVVPNELKMLRASQAELRVEPVAPVN